MNLLRTDVEGEDRKISDILYLWHKEGTFYETMFKTESNNVLSKVYGNCYSLSVDDEVIHGSSSYAEDLTCIDLTPEIRSGVDNLVKI